MPASRGLQRLRVGAQRGLELRAINLLVYGVTDAGAAGSVVRSPCFYLIAVGTAANRQRADVLHSPRDLGRYSANVGGRCQITNGRENRERIALLAGVRAPRRQQKSKHEQQTLWRTNNRRLAYGPRRIGRVVSGHFANLRAQMVLLSGVEPPTY